MAFIALIEMLTRVSKLNVWSSWFVYLSVGLDTRLESRLSACRAKLEVGKSESR